METIKDGIELPKRKRGRPRKNPLPEIAEALDESEVITPDWKVFNIQEIAEINLGATKIINLKNVKTTKDGDKYISINGRKYYEFKGQGEPQESMYILKGSSLFIGDKLEGLTNRDGVSFRYTRGIGENISFEQRKSKYVGGAVHIKDMYKSESLSASEILAIIKHGGKIVKITKNMIDKYLANQLNKTMKKAVETAIMTNPDVFAYMENPKK